MLKTEHTIPLYWKCQKRAKTRHGFAIFFEDFASVLFAPSPSFAVLNKPVTPDVGAEATPLLG